MTYVERGGSLLYPQIKQSSPLALQWPLVGNSSLRLPYSSDHLPWWLPQVLPPEPNTPGNIYQQRWQDADMVLHPGSGSAIQIQSCGLTQLRLHLPQAREEHSLPWPFKSKLSQKECPLQLCPLGQYTLAVQKIWDWL